MSWTGEYLAIVSVSILLGLAANRCPNRVLNPANTSATPNPTADKQEPAFNGASSTSGGVPFTSAVITTTTSTAAAPTLSVSASPSLSPSPSPSAPPSVARATRDKITAVGAAALLGGAVVWANS